MCGRQGIQVDGGIEHLPGITEVGVVERKVAHPQRSKAGTVCGLGEPGMVLQRREWGIRIALQRHDEAEDELVRPETRL